MENKEEVKSIEIVVPEKGIPLRGMNYDSGVFIDGKRLPVTSFEIICKANDPDEVILRLHGKRVDITTI